MTLPRRSTSERIGLDRPSGALPVARKQSRAIFPSTLAVLISGQYFFHKMTERIGPVLPKRSTLRVPRTTVEGERLRLIDAGLDAHPLKTLPRGLLLDSRQDRAPQFPPAGLGMHEHALHFAVAG